MADEHEDLWPDDIADEPTDRAPLLILREQATRLGERTGQVVQAKVSADPTPGADSLELQFTIHAPALGGYEYVLLRAIQPVDLYPIKMEFEGNTWTANDEEGFKQYLESLFKSPRTRKIVSNLVAQSRSA